MRTLTAIALAVSPFLALVACTPLDETYQVWSYSESYGLCQGYCNETVVVNGGQVLYNAFASGIDEPEIDNTGELTQAGTDALRAAAIDRDVEFDDVYGCPDCNDGGAAELELILDDETQVVQYPIGDAPEDLEPVDALFRELLDTLATCGQSDLVTVDDGCMPLGGE